MSADIAQVAKILVVLNAAALVVMIPLAFIGSALVLDALEKFDVRLRRRDEKRPPWPIDEKI